MYDLILTSILKFLRLNYFRINYKSRHTFAPQECSLSLHEKERMCASFTKKKHDQPYLNLKIGEDLPNKTQELPPQNQK